VSNAVGEGDCVGISTDGGFDTADDAVVGDAESAMILIIAA